MLRADVSRKRDLAIKRHRAERVEHRMFVKKLLEGLVLVLRRQGYALLPPPMRCLCTSLSPFPGTGPLHFDSLSTLPREGGIFLFDFLSNIARGAAYPGSHLHRHDTLLQALARRPWASTKS